MAHKSKILIIGGTGYIGKYIIEEIAKAGHPTFALVRENTASNPENSKLIKSFKSFGVTLLYGDIYHHERLVKAIKQVDVVICAFGSPEQIADQVKIIAAIKEAGNIKKLRNTHYIQGNIGGFQRFFPSDFRTDFDRVHAVEPAAHFFGVKASVRRSIEAEGIPYTYLVSNGFVGFLEKYRVEGMGMGRLFVMSLEGKIKFALCEDKVSKENLNNRNDGGLIV
ncbi:phenylcoumaran benzylic ether reductase Betv6-like [Quercus suber]|uniref:phenylcoumaran benzylic ether reductase Betv6-like n=1 Tax=Quercus suber TaxID=58331 RepID=UPI0032DE8774